MRKQYKNKYIYPRGNQLGEYLVNNSLKTLTLGREISAVLPGKKFNVICKEDNVSILFKIPLSSAEKSILDTEINRHKSYTV